MTEKLFEPGRIGNKTTRNRFVAQPMEGNCADPGGAVSELCLQKYCEQARGNWGILIAEAISITPDSLARKHELVMNRKNLDGFKQLVDKVKTIDPQTVLLFQITHSGPVSNPGFSEQVHTAPHGPGRYLSGGEIERLREEFVQCALLAEEAGADGIDFKICHGYLGAELLRPSNVREDQWGGEWENRTRFFRESMHAIRAGRKNSGFILGSRISMYEGIRGGCGTAHPDEVIEDLSEMTRLIRSMARSGCDYVNISAGIPAQTPVLTRPVRQAELMYLHHLRYTRTAKEALRQEDSDMAVIGSAYSALGERAIPVAGEMLSQGYADFIGWGRQTLADPLTPRKLMDGQEPDYCTACSGCSKMMIRQTQVGCIVHNPYYKSYWHEQRSK